MKRSFIFISLMIILFALQFSCTQNPPTDLTKTAFIPRPVEMTATQGSFKLNPSVGIFYREGNDMLKRSADILSEEIEHISGIKLQVASFSKITGKGIYLAAGVNDQITGDEGYSMDITSKRIIINGRTSAGCFYGTQTLLQAIQPVTGQEEYMIATGSVRDFPQYSYRGAMLDVARHFFSVEDVKRFIDFLSTYKMNVLHLHLSDDQGWRIEIKSWPDLTRIGGITEVGGGDGGWYSQEQYAEIVLYAEERHITIVPEIDMPGHTNAALAAYPELNCDGKARDLYTGTEVGFSTLCTSKEITYRFADDVIRELSAITPGPWIHIGGDESHVTKHDDYVYFINRVQGIVTKYGKEIIGWDEIANAGLEENVAVQYWANTKNTLLGLEKGAKVIMSPAKKAYLDMQYDSTTHLGLHWAGYIEVDTGYLWDPATLVPEIPMDKILGIEAPLWTETATNMDELEYLVFPRLPGYAEIGWTAPEQRDWEDYKSRLAAHGKRFETMGIDFYPSPKIPWQE